MTNEELDELQKVRSIVDRFKDIDEETCTAEKVFDEEAIINSFLKNAYSKFFVPTPDEERRERILERYNNLPDTNEILVNLENGKYYGCRMYNRDSTLQKRADWIMEDLINNAVHAECNALLQCNPNDAKDSTLYLFGFERDDNGNNIRITAEPCMMCRRIIRNMRVKTLIGGSGTDGYYKRDLDKEDYNEC